jgi:twinkle protein
MPDTSSTESDSSFLHKEPCPACGSRDNLARYTDGHGFCFGCKHYEPSTDSTTTTTTKRKPMPADLIPLGESIALEGRKLSEETCQKWRYTVSKMPFDWPREEPLIRAGEDVHVANYLDDTGTVVAQKIRSASKQFCFLGDTKAAGLYGQWLWRNGGKQVVITEGELDALSVSQVNGNKWPVVSVPNGAQGAKKALERSLEWLEKFESIIFMFDNDEHGAAAVQECAPLFTPGKVKIAKLTLKDASDMLKAGRGGEIIEAMWGAKEFRPDGIVTVADIEEEALKPIEQGLSWPWPALTAATYGQREGELYTIGAGTGVGKTDVLTQLVMHDLTVHHVPVAGFFLETSPVDTLVRVAGKLAGKTFHVPGDGWTPDELREAIAKVKGAAPLYLYDNFGATDWQVIKGKIAFLAQAMGVKDFFIDHLTALAAGEEDERVFLENTMEEIAGLTKRLKLRMHLVSHLATPEGKSHEEGGRVTIRHFKGSRAIGFWSHFMFGLERDQQEEDLTKRNTTTFRILKDRKTGRGTGKTFALTYDPKTGLLNEGLACPFPVNGKGRDF